MSTAWVWVGTVTAAVSAGVSVAGAVRARRSAQDAKQTQRLIALDEIHAALVRMSEITDFVGNEGWAEWKRLRDRLPALIAKARVALPIASRVGALRPEQEPDSAPDRPGVRRALIVDAIAEVEAAMRSLA